jgi:hypothetical protein
MKHEENNARKNDKLISGRGYLKLKFEVEVEPMSRLRLWHRPRSWLVVAFLYVAVVFYLADDWHSTAAAGVSDPFLAPTDTFGWKEYIPLSSAKDKPHQSGRPIGLVGVPASSIVDQPVYVSITTISTRIKMVHKTIWQLLNGTVIPDSIYLFVSPDPFLLDQGVSAKDLEESHELQRLIKHYPVKIIFADNIGPHRKLLPLLRNKWTEDCLIITFDDEPKYWLENYVRQLLSYYVASNGSSIVTLKARRLSFCHVPPFKVLSYNSWGEALYGMHEFFLLPTGTGGILYRPRFMHPVVFNRAYINITKTTDDLAFRLASMVRGTLVATGCRKTRKQVTTEYRHGSNISRACSDGAFLAPSRSLSVLASNANLFSVNSKNDTVHRRLEDAGLFGSYNRKKGNDNSFYAALKYLQRKGLINMSALAAAILPVERKVCFENMSSDLDVKDNFPGGSISCMVTKCRHPNYSKALESDLTDGDE